MQKYNREQFEIEFLMNYTSFCKKHRFASGQLFNPQKLEDVLSRNKPTLLYPWVLRMNCMHIWLDCTHRFVLLCTGTPKFSILAKMPNMANIGYFQSKFSLTRCCQLPCASSASHVYTNGTHGHAVIFGIEIIFFSKSVPSEGMLNSQNTPQNGRF